MNKIKSTVLSAKQFKAGPDDGLTEGQFTAYASVFGNKDSYGDIVIQGAFSKTLDEWRASGKNIPLLFGHNMSDPDYNIGTVVEAKEDDIGLWVKCELDLESPKAAQVYRLLKGRRIDQMSFAYDVVKYVVDDENRALELHELKLHEVSVVTVGANQETEILGVKQTASLVDAVKAGRTLSAKNIAALQTISDQLKEAHAAINEVLAAADDKKSSQPEKSEEEASAKGPTNAEDPELGNAKESSRQATVKYLAAQFE